MNIIGARIQANGKTTPEIRRRLAMATAKLNKMANVWKGQCVDTKMRVLKSKGKTNEAVGTRYPGLA